MEESRVDASANPETCPKPGFEIGSFLSGFLDFLFFCLVGVASCPPHIGGLRPPNPLTLGGASPPQTPPPYIGGLRPPNPPYIGGGASPPPTPPRPPCIFRGGFVPSSSPCFFQNPEMVQRRWSWAIFEDFHFFFRVHKKNRSVRTIRMAVVSRRDLSYSTLSRRKPFPKKHTFWGATAAATTAEEFPSPARPHPITQG